MPELIIVLKGMLGVIGEATGQGAGNELADGLRPPRGG